MNAFRLATHSGNRLQYGWLIVAFSMWTQAIMAGCTVYAYGLISFAMNKDFGESHAWANGGITAMLVTLSLAGPYLGPLTDKLPPRRVLLIGITSVAVGFILLSFSQAMWQMTLIFGTFMTVGQFFYGPVISGVLVGRWFRQNPGVAFGISATGSSLGGVFCPTLIQHLIEDMGWRMTLLAIGCGLFVITMIMLQMIRKLDPDISAEPKIVKPEADEVAPETEILKTPAFWIISILIGGMTMTQMPMQINLVPFAETLSIASRQSAGFMTAMALGAVAGKLGVGLLSIRSSIRFSMQILILFTASAAAVFLMWQNAVGLLVGAILVGMSLGGLMPLMSSAYVTLFGARQYGKVYGYIALVTLPCQLSPVVAAALYDWTGSYNVGFVSFLVLLALIFPVCTRLRA
jgi:MFS family permease